MATSPPATALQRFGEFIALIQAALFAFLGILHLGFDLDAGTFVFDEPRSIPAAVLEGVIALSLFLSVLLPGRGALRAGRVIGAQVFAVLGALVGEVAVAYGARAPTQGNDVAYAILLAMAFASMLMIAWHRTPGSRPVNPVNPVKPAAKT